MPVTASWGRQDLWNIGFDELWRLVGLCYAHSAEISGLAACRWLVPDEVAFQHNILNRSELDILRIGRNTLSLDLRIQNLTSRLHSAFQIYFAHFSSSSVAHLKLHSTTWCHDFITFTSICIGHSNSSIHRPVSSWSHLALGHAANNSYCFFRSFWFHI